jgi:hypothetical protein
MFLRDKLLTHLEIGLYFEDAVCVEDPSAIYARSNPQPTTKLLYHLTRNLKYVHNRMSNETFLEENTCKCGCTSVDAILEEDRGTVFKTFRDAFKRSGNSANSVEADLSDPQAQSRSNPKEQEEARYVVKSCQQFIAALEFFVGWLSVSKDPQTKQHILLRCRRLIDASCAKAKFPMRLDIEIGTASPHVSNYTEGESPLGAYPYLTTPSGMFHGESHIQDHFSSDTPFVLGNSWLGTATKLCSHGRQCCFKVTSLCGKSPGIYNSRLRGLLRVLDHIPSVIRCGVCFPIVSRKQTLETLNQLIKIASFLTPKDLHKTLCSSAELLADHESSVGLSSGPGPLSDFTQYVTSAMVREWQIF